MIVGAAVAGLLIISLFLEMVSGPKPVEHQDRRTPAAK
jgi:hypothetical protein